MFQQFKKSILSIPILCLLSSFTCQAELVVIAHPSQETNRISTKELYRLYTGKTKKLNNKSKVVVLDQKAGSASREEFYRVVMKATEAQMKIYWAIRIFSGRGAALLQEKDDAAVKAAVAKEPDHIGYIDKALVDNSVKILYTVRDLYH